VAEGFKVEFPGTAFPPLALEPGTGLATALTAVNSPVLFGCRSGICGTCLVEVEAPGGAVPPPGPDEAEALEIFAPGNARARLACQMRLTAYLRLRKLASD
jgi:ferredoxin